MDEQETSFEELDAYKIAREFRKVMYGVAGKLPDAEKFGLASQVRRAAVSLTNKIAAAHGRFHYLDQIEFVLQARGSLEELLDDLNVCQDEGYLPSEEVSVLKKRAWRVHKVLYDYVQLLRKQRPGDSPRVSENAPGYGPARHESTEPEFFDRFPLAPALRQARRIERVEMARGLSLSNASSSTHDLRRL